MKQKVKRNKTDSSGNVIRTILREELKTFATKEDLKKLATKEELKKLEYRFEVNMDFKLENLERKVDEKAQQYRDQILTSNDKLAKTLETMREEITIGNFQTSEKLEDQEKRIKHLESAQKS